MTAATVCVVPGCGNRHHAKSLCAAHYHRKYRTGDARPDRPLGCRPEEYGDLRAIAYYTGRADARNRRPRRVDIADTSLVGERYTAGYDDQLAMMRGAGVVTERGSYTSILSRLILLALIGASLVACAESTATATNGADPWDIKSADEAFVRRAEAVVVAADSPHDDWHVGVILAERGDSYSWEASVLTSDGPVFIDACRTGASEQIQGFGLITDPGDLIAWSPDGGDNRVCPDEFEVVRKAAA